MNQQLLCILLCNIPAYITALLALWRKWNNGEHYEAVVFGVLGVVVICEGFLAARVLDPDTINTAVMVAQANLATLIVPILFMFHAPSVGADRLNKTVILLFALTLLLFTPAVSLDWNPIYSKLQLTEPKSDYGLSLSVQGKPIYYVSWAAVIIVLQSLLALRKVRRVAAMVRAQGAHYSRTTRAVMVWDFSCGFYLTFFFLLPVTVWQQPVMRWIFYITSSLIVTLGSLLIFLGFDLNPISDENGKRFSLDEFVLENSDLVNHLRHLIDEENICLERGIQAETLVQRLGTNHIYFERMIRAQYGCSFPELVHRRRIEHVRTLINRIDHQLTNDDLAHIAVACGYLDASTLRTLWEQVTGTPLQM